MLSLLLALNACLPLDGPLTKSLQKRPADQQLFQDGLDLYGQQQDSSDLLHLRETYPTSAWSDRAATILSLIDLVGHQQQQIQSLQQELERCPGNNSSADLEDRLKRCSAARQTLQQELDIAQERLEALRELSIELELKEP